MMWEMFGIEGVSRVNCILAFRRLVVWVAPVA
jgi:hypothetical protein